MNIRFAEPCRDKPLDFVGFEFAINARSEDAPPAHECLQDLYLGLFFDGTNNNKFRDTPGYGHSNVARLYEAFIGSPAKQQPPTLAPAVVAGQRVTRPVHPDQAFKPDGFPAQDFPYYRKIYVPGVGTPFPDVGDTGTEQDKTLGLAMAFLGEARLCWAQLQVCNQVHAALTGKAIEDALSFKVFARGRATYTPDGMERLLVDYRRELNARLPALEKQVARAVNGRRGRKPTLRRIRLSVFGFSRGAAEARAFVSRVAGTWGGSLAGLPLHIDFLGLFDTVASVGLAHSVPGADGHMGWAAGQNLMVPAPVKRCVHLVAAHEVRASFPLDSVCIGGQLPVNCKEIVYPGVHSDVGGGYPPNDQGRSLGNGGAGDALKLSQVPLAQMYREARMAGVPLAAPGQFKAFLSAAFAIAPALKDTFNAYIAATRTGRVPPTNGKGDAAFARMFPTEEQPRHSLESLLALHYGLYLQWRKSRLGHVHELDGLARNPNPSGKQDIEDIRGADAELGKELAFLMSADPGKYKELDDPTMDTLLKHGASVGAMLGSMAGPPVWFGIAGALAGEKIKGLLVATMKQKQAQWDAVWREVWLGKPLVAASRSGDVARLFEGYVHDSRAWFKALLSKDGDDNADRLARLLKSLLGVDGYEMAPDDEDWFTLGGREAEKARQHRALKARMGEQLEAGDHRAMAETKQRLDALTADGPLIQGGREPYRMYGYLRTRRVYQNGAIDKQAYVRWQEKIQQEENARRRDARIMEENARYEAERKKILADEYRVIAEGRVKGEPLAEYQHGTKLRLDSAKRQHESALSGIR